MAAGSRFMSAGLKSLLMCYYKIVFWLVGWYRGCCGITCLLHGYKSHLGCHFYVTDLVLDNDAGCQTVLGNRQLNIPVDVET